MFVEIRRFLAVVFVLSLTTVATAGSFPIVGTGDGLLVLKALSEAFSAANREQSVEIPPSIGSGGGIAAVGSDREVIARVARELKPNEIASGLAYDPLFSIPSVFFVHPGVPVQSLSAMQIRGIFNGEITNWREVGGPDLRIRVVRREDADSTVLVFRETLSVFKDIKFTERSKLALTTQEAIRSVIENSGAIGFGPLSDIRDTKLKSLSVDGVPPSDTRYPSLVKIAVVYKPHRLTDDIKRFLSFLQTPDAARIVRSFGAHPHIR
ncbi:MAG TPA: substrate-binding domain-containing protein [Rhabdaerophilum sp.]|nr:substrate-binding domain-containing protein [Rhabdaerophilum sp.]